VAKNWIAGAIGHPGALTRQAKRAGTSPMAFARKHQGSPGVTGQRARLAVTLGRMHHGGASPAHHVSAASGALGHSAAHGRRY
jgi:hypothetical protein